MGTRLIKIIFLASLVGSCNSVNFAGSHTQVPLGEPSKISAAELSIDSGQQTDDKATPVIDTKEEAKVDNGLIGGHFDVDTSSSFYEFNEGETDGHVHEYDTIFGLSVDLFDIKSSKLKNITTVIPPSQQFRLLVANAKLSPGAYITINGSEILASAFNSIHGDTNFSLGEEAVKISELKIRFEKDSIKNGGIVPTTTGCVVANIQGPQGEYRNGAFTIQAIDSNQYSIDNQTLAAAQNAEILFEVTIFWHKDSDCSLRTEQFPSEFTQ